MLHRIVLMHKLCIQMYVSYVVWESHIHLLLVHSTRNTYTRMGMNIIHVPRLLSMGRVVIEYVRTTELGDYQVVSGGALLLLELG